MVVFKTMFKRLNVCTLLFITCVTMIACSKQNSIISYIIFPDNIICCNNHYHKDFNGTESDLKLLVYIDSIVCNECVLKNILVWHDVVDYIEKHSSIISFIYILSTKKNETEKILQFAQKDPLSYPLYVDTMNIFAEQNIAISKRGIYIALVNEKDSVILDGDPIANDDMWQQYKKLIEDYEQKNCKNNKE